MSELYHDEVIFEEKPIQELGLIDYAAISPKKMKKKKEET